MFGIPLTVLVDSDRKRTNNPELRVPLVLSEIISFLENNALQDEGILRKSGSAARIKALKQVRLRLPHLDFHLTTMLPGQSLLIDFVQLAQALSMI